MIPTYLRQLSYITERRSWADTAIQVGKPTSLIKSYAKGTKTPDDATKNDIRNAYRRTAYATLRETGYASKEAQRWSTYRPETAQLYGTALYYKIADLTVGLLGMRASQQKVVNIKEYINKYFDDTYNDIKRGIARSRRTTEEILEGDIT